MKEGLNREKLDKFFSRISGDITAYTDSCIKILIMAGAMSFNVHVSEEGEVKVFEGKGEVKLKSLVMKMS
ncbi:MAG: hypothetical protein QXK73_06395 [Candidatus Bathyarchaeia archaeon]